MALTDAFIAICIAVGLMYYFLYRSPVRWKRMLGCMGILTISLGFGVIAKSVPMYLLFLANLAIAGLKFMEDVGETIKAVM